MKKMSLFLSMLVFMVALGAAFATSSSNLLITEVWRKPTMGGICAPTDCLITGINPCGVTGFTYFNNAACTGVSISPKKN
ncbi:MAG: hypothetical protein JSS79_04685 [Bacteroidetes bacterium]|jgi:hypothetical protein|nr:hypothetical protein [Bacteroidota bacterium]